MPQTVQVQTSFTTGEISPKTLGRSDLKRFLGALAQCENFILPKQGNAERRTGTRFVAEVKNSADLTILHPFRSSTVARYIIEFGNLYARFYVDRGVLLDTDLVTPVEIVTPWTTDQLRDLKFTQSADILYAFHPDHETREIQRTSATTFRIRFLGAKNGPYQPRNVTATEFVASALTGSITVDSQDASGNPSVVGINDGRGFLSTDIDRQILWIEGTNKRTWFTITGVGPEFTIVATNVANPLNVQVIGHPYATGEFIHIKDTVGTTGLNDITYKITKVNVDNFTLDGIDGSPIGAGTGGTARRATKIIADIDQANDITAGQQTRRSWALGAWSDTSGWPRCGTFHQQRLWFGGTNEETQAVWSSETGIFDVFNPTDPAGEVLDDNGITFTIDANLVMNIHDMKSHARGLIILTDEAEVVASTNDSSFAPMTPSNKGARIQSTHGINPKVQSIVVDNTILFNQASQRKVRGLGFKFEDDIFRADDLTVLAENISGDGFVDIAYQEEPNEILWLVRKDGQLVGLTYDPQEQVFAWHRHIIGGTFLGGDAIVESCAVIRDDPGDLLWLIVKRTVNGSQVRHVEFVGDRFETTDNAEEAFFVDSGIPQSDFFLETIIGITKGNPTTFTTTRLGLFGFPTPSDIALRDIQSTGTLAGILNGNTFVYTDVSDIGGIHTFTLAVDTSSASGDYLTGGTARKEFTTISGLDHLEAETVRVAGDGIQLDDEVVSSGSITLSTASSLIYVGLPSPYKLVTVPITPAAAGFDTRTSLLRVISANLMLDNSQGGSFGLFGGTLFDIEYTDTALFTGIKEIGIQGPHDWRFQLELSSSDILPMTLLQIGLEVEIGS